MNQKERVEAFLKDLNTLTDKYGLEITAEGTSPLLLDIEEGGYAGEFGRSFFGGDYKIYED
ncbi:hypothetical protein [Metabacillus arenae]|uniref:Uncharacterized protein n=1 Tax=Metabacillus arenae TaxID=2771434 RepID=A0A926RW40_9BACI|nr:hypothetical protein [Metabacillus arenae]MBD1379160.1 hypothetical protein [Metabacillus arenae]